MTHYPRHTTSTRWQGYVVHLGSFPIFELVGNTHPSHRFSFHLHAPALSSLSVKRRVWLRERKKIKYNIRAPSRIGIEIDPPAQASVPDDHTQPCTAYHDGLLLTGSWVDIESLVLHPAGHTPGVWCLDVVHCQSFT